MNTLFFDIETLPAGPDSEGALRILFEKKKEKKRERLIADGESSTDLDEKMKFEDFHAGTSFDGGFGRICCIALAMNDDPVRVYSVDDVASPESERKVLRDFWAVAAQADRFVGHNVMEFDLRFLLQRSIVLGIQPTWKRFQEAGKKPWEMGKYLSFARYQNLPIFDTMKEWTNWGQDKIGLEHLALALGIPTPKGEGIDGSQVWKFFQDGKCAEISEYCKRDVETTRAIYNRMVFTSR